jgi:hypothetical protein
VSDTNSGIFIFDGMCECANKYSWQRDIRHETTTSTSVNKTIDIYFHNTRTRLSDFF